MKKVLYIILIFVLLLLYGCFKKDEPEETIQCLSDNIQNLSTENSTEFDPNDEYYKFAWHLKVQTNLFTLRNNIDKNADLNITKAWQITRGKGIKVAIIDDSFEPDHEDIKDNVFSSYDVDEEDCDVRDVSPNRSHGHMASGVLAAVGNNQKGVIGIAPEAKLILIKQIANDDAKTIKAFEYAKQAGARVVSCSWGSESVSEAVKSKIDELYNEGIVIVFAFGNEGANFDLPNINDESELDSVIGVGASNESNDVAYYSNYGSNLDILAPAGEIGIPTVDKMGPYGDNNQLGYVDDSYTFFPGTSAATPLVAGTAALMLSVNPSLTPDQVRSIMIETADKIGLYYDSNCFNIRYGYGKINSSKAVLRAIDY